MRIRQGAVRLRRQTALAGMIVAAAVLALPAAASAWQVTVHVHGGGKVVETTPRALMNCTTAIGAAESTVTDCVAGSPSGVYNSGDIVSLQASVPTAHFDRGWRFLKWVDSGAGGGRINCDPQGTTGDHTQVDCQFQIFENLEVDLYFEDVEAPQTSISNGPSGAVQSTSATFGFDSTDPNASFQCRLDRPGLTGTFTACGGPSDKSESYTGLTTNGAYTFQVRGIDPSGNVDDTPASRSWTVDTVAPVPSISGGPAEGSSTSTTGATFGVSSNEGTLQCRLDGGSFSACGSPKSYSGLGDGSHTFTLRATDAAGNSATAARTWTVDTVAPAPTIDGGPAQGSRTRQRSVSFDVGSSENGASLSCALDSGAPVPCTDPQAYGDLPDGEHTFTLTATDTAGNSDTANRTWTVDTAPPQTTITSGPSGETEDPSPQFGFSSEPGAGFACRIDPEGPGGWEACSSPKSYPALANGSHRFEVRATDAAGNVDPSPAVRVFSVVAPDADGDDIPDGADACDSVAGASANGCPDVTRQLSLSYSRKRRSFKGTLFANAPACAADWTVRLFKIKRGPDPQVGETTTGSSGKYALEPKWAKGKYRTAVEAATIASAGNCLAARSPKVRVKPTR